MPITAQTLGVMLAGSILGARRGGPSTRVVIDTSAVIDGRIVDIARTGFILALVDRPAPDPNKMSGRITRLTTAS